MPRVSPSRFFLTPSRSLLVAATALAGCQSSSGNSDSIASLSSPATVQGITIDASPYDTRIGFTLVSPESHPMRVDVECSEDRGASYVPASTLAGRRSALASSPTGLRHEISWAPATDLEDISQSDLRIRLTPRDELTGVAGHASESRAFSLGSNQAPELVRLDTPVGIVGGEIELRFRVADANADHVGILLEYSLDGVHWNDATAGGGGEGVEALSAPQSGAEHVITWDSQADLSGVVSDSARVRLTPVDVTPGNSLATDAFQINLRAPILSLLTVGSIPEVMNGSIPYTNSAGALVDFKLGVARSGIVLRVKFTPAGGGGALTIDGLELTADVDLGDSTPAGTDLGPLFTAESGGASWTIPETHELPTGDVVFEARMRDEYGNYSETKRLEVRALNASAERRPFNVVDRWYLKFDTDFFTISSSGSSTISLTVSPDANGVADFLEDLVVLGLRTDEPTDECAEIDTNGRLLALVQEEFLGRLREYYGGSADGEEEGFSENLVFTLTPGSATSVLRIGGDDINAGYTIGRAQFDFRNSGGNTNSSTQLGIFTTNLIAYYVNSSASFKASFDALIPGRGTPAGEHSLDHIVLADSFDRFAAGNAAAENQRYDRIWSGIRGLARAAATIAAHEIGHSIGLCANGPPPTGLFGNVTGPSFSGPYTNAYHFDSVGNNLMAAALSFAPSIATGPTGYRFNELNECYLREWTLLGE